MDAIIDHITKENLYTRMKRHIEHWGKESQIGGIHYFTNPERGINEQLRLIFKGAVAYQPCGYI